MSRLPLISILFLFLMVSAAKASYSPPYSPVDPQPGENLNHLIQRIGIAEDQGFIGTFTCLGIIKEDAQDIIMTLSTLSDLSTLINVLDELLETITFIEDITQTLSFADFIGTFTAIAAVQTTVNEIYGTTTVIQTDVTNGFVGTFTCLGVIKEDLTGVFTAIDQVDINITDLQTTIEQDFDGTFTAIAAINLNVTTTSCDLTGVYTAINEINLDLSGVYTAIDAISLQVTTTVDLSGVYTAIDQVQITIDTDFNGTFTSLKKINDDIDIIKNGLCDPAIIQQSDVGITTFTIDTPGLYVFSENISFIPNLGQPAIEIITDNVVLDMCGKVLYQNNATSDVDAIRVQGNTSANPRTNVVIKNGSIENFTRAGISVGINTLSAGDTACTRIELAYLDIVNCGIRGIELIGSSASTMITESIIKQCRILECCTNMLADFGLYMIFASDIFVQDCELNQNGNSTVSLTIVGINTSKKCEFNNVTLNCNTGSSLIGFDIDTSEQCIFTNCSVLKNDATGSLTGFRFTGGSANLSNILTNCLVADNTCSTGPLYGFALFESVNKNILRDCIATNNSATGAVATANCFGFYLDQAVECSLIRFRAMYNQATGNGTTNICAGLNVSTSGGAGTGVKRSEFVEGVTASNNGFADARSFGIRAFSGANGNENNAYINNVAYRNGPSSPLNATQIIADSSMGSNPGGVPFLSIESRTLSNLNSVNDLLANKRLTD